MSSLLQPTIILLKDGTDSSQGKGQLLSNFSACSAIVDILRTTLGPRGMDKLIYDEKGKVTVSNDGATIMKLLDVVHPAAKSLVDIARSQDAEVGDGTTSVVVLAGEIIKEVKPFVEDGVHPQVIIKSLRTAVNVALARLNEICVRVASDNIAEKKRLLQRCAATALQSKLIAQQREFFANMIVDAVAHLDSDLNIDLIGIKKIPGGALEDSMLVEGCAFKKAFSYAGFEQQPKRFENCKICLLNVELELKAEKENAEVRLDDPTKYQSIVDAEWNIIYEKLDKLVASGAKVVLSRLPIGDLATQYFADRDLFCAGRIPVDDLQRVSKATGAQVQTSVHNMPPEALGTCALFEERQVGSERFNFIQGGAKAKTATIILRGGAEQFIEETDRSVHDAIMIVRRAIKHTSVVAGGGAIEMELSRHIREYARSIPGKSQLIINSFAKALEVIPRQLAENAGFDATDVLMKLRFHHAKGDEFKWYGVDINNDGGVIDCMETFVWEPTLVKINALSAAVEAVCTILSVDETITSPSAQREAGDSGPQLSTRGRGMAGMMAGRGGRGRPGVRTLQGRGGR
eukprot:gnl/Hemi2/25735_TR8643_c0_g1_i1.p1 gnl/Hemi2/25735_TR8643_c0_g1~~gnl/Hemi2/25735_TR8643_c0_g1_i1.p1  ORF type:complete len:605 (+),score=238.54 gnl/Hemi2/25735_TR8643_c0_g1_i1:95-1816(+)